MRIGIDFDNTIVNTKETVNNYMKKYNIDSFENENQKELFYRQHILNMCEDMTLKDNVVEVLNNLSKKHELYLITYRSNYYNDNFINKTKEYIKKNKIPIKNLYFESYDKGKICNDLKIDLFIDDDINNCLNVKQYNIDVLLFDNIYEGLKTVNNWKEIEVIINGRENCK